MILRNFLLFLVTVNDTVGSLTIIDIHVNNINNINVKFSIIYELKETLYAIAAHAIGPNRLSTPPIKDD